MRRLHQERATDDAVAEALNEISVQSHVRMQVAKTTRVSVARRKKRAGGVKKVVLGFVKYFSRRGGKISMSPEQMLHIAYSSARTPQKAMLAKAGRDTIRRIEHCVAQVTLRAQAK